MRLDGPEVVARVRPRERQLRELQALQAQALEAVARQPLQERQELRAVDFAARERRRGQARALREAARQQLEVRDVPGEVEDREARVRAPR